MDDKYLTVSAITRYLKAKFDSDSNLKLVFLKGEISNFKSHTSGHLYFSVKDEQSKINAIMFKTNASKLNFKPLDGTQVLIAGRIMTKRRKGKAGFFHIQDNSNKLNYSRDYMKLLAIIKSMLNKC